MATYKTKVKDLKNINNKTDIGGAPFWGDDILGLQINAKADFINTHENLRRRLPIYEYYRGGGPNPPEKMHGMGLILSGLTYNNASTSAIVVNPGFVLLEGEVCYYAGGTFNITSGSVQKFLYLSKGAALTESRVFADGSSKEFKVEYGVNTLLSDTSTNGPTTEPLPSADLTKDFIFIILGDNPQFNGLTEKYCTIDAALGLIDLGGATTLGAFTDVASLGTGWAVDTNFFGGKLQSRVLANGQTQLAGVVKRTFTGGSTAVTVGTMAVENLSFTGEIPINCMVKVGVLNYNFFTDYILTVLPTGLIRLRPRPGQSWPSDEIFLFIDAIITGAESAFTYTYTFDKYFMDVTP